MHPILVSRGRLAVYVVMWLPLGVLLAALLVLEGVFRWGVAAAVGIPLTEAYGFLCLSAWYVASGSPFERVGVLRAAGSATVAAFVSTAVWLLAARGWLGFVAAFGRVPDVALAFRASAPTLFAFGFLLYLLAMAVSYLGIAFEASRDAESRGLELEVLAREAELRALRAQIDPHFLFNSLQSISALTASDPAAARRMCLLLADFLRDTLSMGAKNRIALSSEFALARRFLEIEQVRFGDRLHVDIEDGHAGASQVPPLLLQPLVENAVTHGVAHVLAGGAVRIRAERRSASVAVTVENPCDPDRPPTRGTGLGLRNVRERLHSLYGEDAALRTEERDGRYLARIEMPLEEPQ